MAKCLARFGSAAVIGLGGSTSPGVSLPRLSIRTLSPQLDHFRFPLNANFANSSGALSKRR
jgi:hypothetical protein